MSSDARGADTHSIAPIDAARIVASHGLPGAELPAAASDLEVLLSPELLGLVSAHKLHGLLAAAIEDGLVTGPGELVARAEQVTIDARATTDRIAAAAVKTVVLLSDHGVRTRVLKGVAMRQLDYDPPKLRGFGDVDLLIRPEDHGAAIAALATGGVNRVAPPVRNWWERRFGKSVVLRSPDGIEIDLHLRITGGYFGEQIDHRRLWDRPGEPIGRSAMLALDREGRLLNACCHCVLGGGSGLRAMRDVAQLVLVRDADWRTVVEHARVDGADTMIASAVRSTWAELGLDHRHPIVGWAASHRPDPVQITALRRYQEAFGVGWAPEGQSVLAALGPFDRVRFLAGLAIPSRASLRARGRGWFGHARQSRRLLGR